MRSGWARTLSTGRTIFSPRAANILHGSAGAVVDVFHKHFVDVISPIVIAWYVLQHVLNTRVRRRAHRCADRPATSLGLLCARFQLEMSHSTPGKSDTQRF
jgi:hypothetical protein